MQHGAVGVDHHDGASRDALELAVGHEHAVGVEELGVLERRAGRDVLDALGATEASGGGREVGGDTQHGGVVEIGGPLVERAHAGLTGGGVDRREDVEHDPLTGEVRRADRLPIGLGEGEVRSGRTRRGNVAVGVDGVAPEGELCHVRQHRGMTPAVELLRSLGIEHEIVQYDHDPNHPSFGEEAVEALGIDTDAAFKTLMVTLDDGRQVIGVVPVACTLDLKAIAAAAGAKKARMTDPAEAERRSGYVVGGISPFGQKQVLPTFVDEWATALDRVYCSGGRRGLEVIVDADAFRVALDAMFTAIAVWR